ncbi:Uma2 family endonuclease [Tumidithrix elongata RA019]|uniref:Uma2 family endonuclease n=1 Tax=Tumidithrix elongata BACA0141 TaxID=2716417 RepID=A0AAW9PTW3_9CYAN|nr:Uma2 family endonuclease [Tumidithrix elongata RA019]
MATLVRISQIETLPGQSTILHDIDWQQFEAILEDLGEKRAARVAYFDGVLEIEMPLPEHEKVKVLIGDFIKALLDEMEVDFEPFGSSTFKHMDKQAGLEPDDCFYIQNNVVMRGARKLDLSIDPPLDLAIEVDVTSKTKLEVYQAIAVPELWIYLDRSLKIYLLCNGEYIESSLSPTFGTLPVREVIPQFIERTFQEGRGAAFRAFRAWAKQNLAKL